jgi:hypothetical protein
MFTNKFADIKKWLGPTNDEIEVTIKIFLLLEALNTNEESVVESVEMSRRVGDNSRYMKLNF